MVKYFLKNQRRQTFWIGEKQNKRPATTYIHGDRSNQPVAVAVAVPARPGRTRPTRSGRQTQAPAAVAVATHSSRPSRAPVAARRLERSSSLDSSPHPRARGATSQPPTHVASRARGEAKRRRRKHGCAFTVFCRARLGNGLVHRADPLPLRPFRDRRAVTFGGLHHGLSPSARQGLRYESRPFFAGW